MNTADNKQVDKLLKDIASIKEVINRNKPILQQVINLTHFRLLMLLTGLSISLFSLLVYFLINSYGSHSAIPANLKWAVYITMGIASFILSIMKMRLYRSSVKKVDSGLTLSWLYKELFTGRIAHIYISVIFLISFLVIFFIYKGIPYYITPTIAILFGLYGLSATIFHIKHSLIMGYWFFITGIGLTLYNTIHPAIAIFISFGIGFILLGIVGYIYQKSVKAE